MRIHTIEMSSYVARCLGVLATGLVLISSSVSTAAPLTHGNLLVTSAFSELLREYTPAGDLVQSFTVPDVDGDTFLDLRDTIVDPSGRVQIFSVEDALDLATLDPATSTYEHHTFAGWSVSGNVSYGGIGAIDKYVFVTDMDTPGGDNPLTGVIRFDRTDYSAVRFADTEEYQDLVIGLDGNLYALRDASQTYDVFDPLTLTPLGTHTMVDLLFFDIRGIAVDVDGSVFAAVWDDNIYHVDGSGNLLDTLSPDKGSIMDIDIRPDGKIVAATFGGEIILTDRTLDSFTSFEVDDSLLHVSFVPEPSTWWLAASASSIALAGAGRRRRSARRRAG